MSHEKFYIVPSDMDYVPTPEQQRALEEYFMQVCGVADGHYIHSTDAPTLVGPVEIDSVRCPACKATLPMFTPDYGPTPYLAWFDSISELEARATCELPCCHARAKAMELELDPATPYARFGLGALNPLMDDEWGDDYKLRADLRARFEELLGMPIREFWFYGT